MYMFYCMLVSFTCCVLLLVVFFGCCGLELLFSWCWLLFGYGGFGGLGVCCVCLFLFGFNSVVD